jgi:hypothetical protein
MVTTKGDNAVKLSEPLCFVKGEFETVDEPDTIETPAEQRVDTGSTIHPRLLNAINHGVARRLAKAGIHVFPCNSAKRPLCAWRTESTTDLETIKLWWTEFTRAIVGIDCGKSELLVIDPDRHEAERDGVANFDKILADNDVLPDHPISKTYSDGNHHFFKQPSNPLGNSEGLLKDLGINVRGVGGFVIAPGCVIAAGSILADDSISTEDAGWAADRDAPDLAEEVKSGTLAVCPEWLATKIRTRKDQPAETAAPGSAEARSYHDHEQVKDGPSFARDALGRNCRELENMPPESGRNNATNGIGYRMGRMIAAGWISRFIVERDLEAACRRNGLLDDDGRKQCLATIKSGIDAGLKEPMRPALSDLGGDDTIRIEILADGTRIDVQTGECLGAKRERVNEAEEAYFKGVEKLARQADGLIAEMTEFTVETSFIPNPTIALASSIAVVGTLLGRRISTPTRAGTHLYQAVLDDSGGGKQHGINATKKYLTCAGATSCIGPGEYMSGSALLDMLNESPLVLSCLDEFGSFLKASTAGTTSSHANS